MPRPCLCIMDLSHVYQLQYKLEDDFIYGMFCTVGSTPIVLTAQISTTLFTASVFEMQCTIMQITSHCFV